MRSSALILSLSKEDLALFIDREDERAVRRGKVKADDILHLVDKLLVVGQLERLHQMRLEPVGGPDTLHAGVAEPDRLGERTRRPMRGRRPRLVQRYVDNPGNHRGTQRLLPAGPARIALQPRDAALDVAVPPAIGRLLGLTQRTHNRRHAGAIGPHQNNPSPPNQLLRRVPARHPAGQLHPICRR